MEKERKKEEEEEKKRKKRRGRRRAKPKVWNLGFCMETEFYMDHMEIKA